VRHALQAPGVKARMFAAVADDPIYETHYAVSQALAPRLGPFAGRHQAAVWRRADGLTEGRPERDLPLTYSH
jgi:hypothetical protein